VEGYFLLRCFSSDIDLCAQHVAAQQTLGSINGTVVDPSVLPLPSAKVTVTDAAINFSASTLDAGGRDFSRSSICPSATTWCDRHAGFENYRDQRHRCARGKRPNRNAHCNWVQVTESVEVTATPLLNATDATNGYTLDSSQIGITPLATAVFTQMAVLSTGVNAELHIEPRLQRRNRQSADLGEWPARHLEHVPV